MPRRSTLAPGLGTINLTSMLPVLENANGITINGNGNTIDGGSTSATTGDRVFFIGVSTDIAAVSPSLTATTGTQWAINNLTIQNGNARGGNGGAGGGAGLGGGIFVNAGNLSLSGVSFSSNLAVGGNGGSPVNSGSGGGMGGNGGTAGAGGGGFGIGADGKSQTNGGAGQFLGGASAGSGKTSVKTYTGGATGGGGGGSDGGSGAGGGGVGGVSYSGQSGGNGGFGGGGGNGGSAGGNGGYGGGAGQGQTASGTGGFGGGGAPARASTGTAGGFGGGAGVGGVNSTGGGGLGAGGAVFVRQGASVTLVDGGISGGLVQGGVGGTAAGNSGQAIGSGLFLAGSANYSVSTGNTVTLADTIGGGVDAQITGGFTASGPGTLVLTAANSFTGGVAITGGALSVSSDANLGAASNAISFDGNSRLQITGTTFNTLTRNISTVAGGIDLPDANAVVTASGVISGTGYFVKSGPGTLVLTNSNTYGNTAIDAGTLRVNNAAGSGAGTAIVMVNGGAMLGGSGTIGVDATASVVVANGATITAGADRATIGTLTDRGSETLQAGATLLAKVAGSSSDRQVVSSLSVPNQLASVTINITGPGGGTAARIANMQYVLVNDTDTSSANPFNSTNTSATLADLLLTNNGVPVSDGSFMLSTQQDAVSGYDLILTTPEPGGLLLAVATAMPLAPGRRRSRRV